MQTSYRILERTPLGRMFLSEAALGGHLPYVAATAWHMFFDHDRDLPEHDLSELVAHLVAQAASGSAMS